MDAVKKARRLGPMWKRRLARGRITQESLAVASPRFHPAGAEVTVQFVNRVLNGKQACPEWFRRMCDEVLAEAEPAKGKAGGTAA